MNPKTRWVAIGLLVAFLGWMALTVFIPRQVMQPKTKTKPSSGIIEPTFVHEGDLTLWRGETPLAKLRIELAESPNELQYGMMYRKSVPDTTGMLFLMPQEDFQSFWMKNTYVSLDIIYLSSQGTVVSIQKNAQPLSEKSLPSEGPALYILEVAGGYTDAIGLQPGDRFTATALDGRTIPTQPAS
jgi:uncharacterized membrane protein (UPF0127 family)